MTTERLRLYSPSMSDPFTLHPRLAADTTALGDWPLCRLLLMNDARFPWIILVPARADLREVHDLPPAERATLIEEVARASALMQQAFKADKMNVAALGNQVPQLHIHIIARFASDPAWPNPVWGQGQARPMSEAERSERTRLLQSLLAR
jgi:diadenosine tetraphosphate (Ap4A) HIT family hydrolase